MDKTEELEEEIDLRRGVTTEQLKEQIATYKNAIIVLNKEIKGQKTKIKEQQKKITDLRRIIRNQRKIIDGGYNNG